MYWFKENTKLFFQTMKKEIIAFFSGVLILFIGFRIKAPKLYTGYALAVLVLLSMACRYNYVADYILKSDMKNLYINKKTVSYILGKNIFSFILTFSIVFIVFIVNILMPQISLGANYYINIIKLGLCIIAFNNIILIFHNKSSELRSNDYPPIKNIELGFKDLIESLPSLVIVFCVYFFNMYFYEITMYEAIATWIFSIIILNYILKSIIL